jgi:hypothetical protein
MKQIIILAGAAALAFSGAAIARPGNGNGNGLGPGNGHGHGHDYGYGERGPVGYGVGGCPPGLAKKHNGCMPPGQARKMFRRGQRYQLGYGSRWSYGRIPYDIRRQYDLSPHYRYYYDNGYLYAVDPRTMLVSQVISALLR